MDQPTGVVVAGGGGSLPQQAGAATHQHRSNRRHRGPADRGDPPHLCFVPLQVAEEFKEKSSESEKHEDTKAKVLFSAAKVPPPPPLPTPPSPMEPHSPVGPPLRSVTCGGPTRQGEWTELCAFFR